MAVTKEVLVLLLAVAALYPTHGEVRVARSGNSLDSHESNKKAAADDRDCDMPVEMVPGFPKFSDHLRKNFCNEQKASRVLKRPERLLPEDVSPEEPKHKTLTLLDIIVLCILCIIITGVMAFVVYKVGEACGDTIFAAFRRYFKRKAKASLPTEIELEEFTTETELEEFTEFFVPRLNIFCNLSKKPGRLTRIPKIFGKKDLVYDIEDQQYYFDIRVNLHHGKFRNTKKKEYLPIEGFTYTQVKNIIQELVHGTEQSQVSLLQALANPDAEASLIVINEAISKPTPVPLLSGENSDDELLKRQAARSVTKKKKTGPMKLTIVNESLVRGMGGSSAVSFATHEPPDKNDSLGYGTASTSVSQQATPKESPSTEGSLEDIATEDMYLMNPRMLQPGTSNEQSLLARRKDTNNHEDGGSPNKQNNDPDDAVPTLQKLARKYVSAMETSARLLE